MKEYNQSLLKSVIVSVSILKHKRLTEEERAITRSNLNYTISEMDKAGIPYKVQNALFWVGYSHNTAEHYLSDLLQLAESRIA